MKRVNSLYIYILDVTIIGENNSYTNYDNIGIVEKLKVEFADIHYQ
ncbi:hypothetical protein [Orenia metallireducens]|nr:hypothetical protein [Orenia metallireducens]